MAPTAAAFPAGRRAGRLGPMSNELAQVNIGRLAAPLDSPQLAAFMTALDPVNAAAEQAPGYVWRLQPGDGNAPATSAFEWDPGDSGGVIINMWVCSRQTY